MLREIRSSEPTVVATHSSHGSRVLHYVCITLISDCTMFSLLVQHLNILLLLHPCKCMWGYVCQQAFPWVMWLFR